MKEEKIGKLFCLDISALENELGDSLSYTRIEVSNEDGIEYFDLYNDNDELCCLDGEIVLVIDEDEDTITLRNENDTNNVSFKLSNKEFMVAAFI